MSYQTAIIRLKEIGYEIFLQGDCIRYKFKGRGTLPESEVRALLDYIKSNKNEIIRYLKGSSTPMPYIADFGSLVIPFDSPNRFHWWNKGQSVLKTLEELKANDEIIKKYKTNYN